MLVRQQLVVCVRTSLSASVCSTGSGSLCQDWSVSVCWQYKNWEFVPGLICQRKLIVQDLGARAKTGLSGYGGLCQD